MSDPVTNVEIEDVLSSIRRLVSAGDEAKAPAKTTEKAQEDQSPETPTRFVLTPALRVTEADDHVESDDADAAFDTAGETTVVFDDEATEEAFAEVASVSSRDSLEATIAELEAAVVDQPDEWEPDGSEVKTVPTWETVSYPPLDEVEDAVAVEEDAADETDPVWDVVDRADDDESDTLAFKHDDLVADYAEPAEHADDDDAQSSDPILTNGPTIAEDAVYSISNPFPGPEEDQRFADLKSVENLAFIHNQPVQVPDDPAEDYGDELLPDPEPVGQDDDLDAYMVGSGQGINEEVLRQMVMDVVREELQGNLGERITRNVRKMVRREIHRALDMQNFD